MRRKRFRRHLLSVECEGLRELFSGRIRLKDGSLPLLQAGVQRTGCCSIMN